MGANTSSSTNTTCHTIRSNNTRTTSSKTEYPARSNVSNEKHLSKEFYECLRRVADSHDNDGPIFCEEMSQWERSLLWKKDHNIQTRVERDWEHCAGTYVRDIKLTHVTWTKQPWYQKLIGFSNWSDTDDTNRCDLD
jgi:hypothetical protein